jgi:hypothetical protein
MLQSRLLCCMLQSSLLCLSDIELNYYFPFELNMVHSISQLLRGGCLFRTNIHEHLLWIVKNNSLKISNLTTNILTYLLLRRGGCLFCIKLSQYNSRNMMHCSLLLNYSLNYSLNCMKHIHFSILHKTYSFLREEEDACFLSIYVDQFYLHHI